MDYFNWDIISNVMIDVGIWLLVVYVILVTLRAVVRFLKS